MKKILMSFLSSFLCAVLIMTNFSLPVKAEKSYMDIIKEYLDNVLKYGRNIEGMAYPQLFVDGINRTTKEPVTWLQQNKVWMPSNLANQQLLMRVLDSYSSASGDMRYKNVAMEQYRTYFNDDNFHDTSGFLYWGGHWSIDQISGGTNGQGRYHEFKSLYPYYELMFEADPAGAKKFVEAYWNAHVNDWSNLTFNRHGYYDRPIGQLWNSEYVKPESVFEADDNSLTFITAGSDLVYAAIMLYKATGDEKPHTWAKRMFQQYMNVRDPVTKLGGYQYTMRGKDLGGDRIQAQYGPEWGELAYEYKRVQGGTANNTYGLPFSSFLYSAEKTNDTQMMNDVFDSLRGWATYVYNPETNLCDPMWSDGTSFAGYVVQREGYAGKIGTVIDYYAPNANVAMTFCVASRLSNGDPTIWGATRGLMRGFGLGDIGTAPGENINVDLNTSVTNATLATGVLQLYQYTLNPQYLQLAERICDNIVENLFVDGFFVPDKNRANVRFSSALPLALINYELAKQGKFDEIYYLCGAQEYIESNYDGVGSTTDSSVIYGKNHIPVESISVDKEEITIIAKNDNGSSNLHDIENHWARDSIRRMNLRGVMYGTPNGFEPDRPVTRGEFIVLLNRLFNVDKKTYAGTFSDVSPSDWFAEDIQAAFDAQIIDPNLHKTGALLPGNALTREEMASLLVKGMIKYLGGDYFYSGYVEQYSDIGDISAWAKDYVDVCLKHGIMQGVTEYSFKPKDIATRAQVCAVLQRVDELLEKPHIPNVGASVLPEEASDKRITYTSSNPGVVQVDENGYLYGISSGTATVSANASGIVKDVTVEVVSAEDWMLSGIYVGSELLEGFDPMKLDYDLDLIRGTTKLPLIQAKNLKSEYIDVNKISRIPGTVKIPRGDRVYTINVTADALNYAINEDFSGIEIGTFVHYMSSKGVTYKTNSSGQDTKTTAVKVQQHPQDSTKKSVLLDTMDLCDSLEFRGYLDERSYVIGPEADEDYLVYEVSFMQEYLGTDLSVSNTIMLYDDVNARPVARFKITGGNIIFTADGGSIPVGTLTEKEFHRLKAVINKRQRTADLYYDNNLVAKDVTLERATIITSVNRLMVTVINPAKMYIEEVQVYTLPKDIYVQPELVSPDMSSTSVVRLEKAYQEDFSSYQIGDVFSKEDEWTAKDGVTIGNPPRGGSKRVGILFPEIIDTTAIEYSASVSSFGGVTVGEAAEDENLVFEFEAMSGTDSLVDLMAGDECVMRLFFSGKNTLAHIGYTPAGELVQKNIYSKLNSKRIYRVKAVINKQKREVDIYLNDTLLLSGEPIYANYYDKNMTIQKILVQTRIGSAYTSHSPGWFGNFSLYEESEEYEEED